MASILVRNLDDATVARLKSRALRHNRSLQGEVKNILETEAAAAEVTAGQAGRRELKIRTVDIPTGAAWSRQEIYGDDGRQ